MNGKDWINRLGAGLLAGLAAALLMTLVILLLRFLFGVATPSELVGDRIAPLLGVNKFLELLGRFGGYNQLKQLGVSSVIAGQIIVGLIGGLALALLSAPTAARPNDSANSRRGVVFVTCLVGALWLLSIILLWPTLGTHYKGLPLGPATFTTVIALLFSYTFYGVALLYFFGLLTKSTTSGRTASAGAPKARRALLVGGVGAMAAVGCGLLLRRLYNLAAFSYDGLRYSGADVQAITPNDRFYVVTKNTIDPDVAPVLWRLEITGLVSQPQTYRYEDLQKLPATTQQTTLRCISNGVGDGLMSNAIWKGVPLRTLLEAANPRAGVVEARLYGVDGYTDTIAFAKAMEPSTLVVYEMNGEPLPMRHGYPVRVIVPGLFGEKSVKWVTRIELVDHDVKGFYEQQGWGPNFVVPTTARFDQPADRQRLNQAQAASGVRLKGVAHAGDRGVKQVEVSLDGGGSWQVAKIDFASSPLAWVLWSYDWKPARPGDYRLVVRATDGQGEVQTAEERGIVPEGATGYHRISVGVEAPAVASTPRSNE